MQHNSGEASGVTEKVIQFNQNSGQPSRYTIPNDGIHSTYLTCRSGRPHRENRRSTAESLQVWEGVGEAEVRGQGGGTGWGDRVGGQGGGTGWGDRVGDRVGGQGGGQGGGTGWGDRVGGQGGGTGWGDRVGGQGGGTGWGDRVGGQGRGQDWQ